MVGTSRKLTSNPLQSLCSLTKESLPSIWLPDPLATNCYLSLWAPRVLLSAAPFLNLPPPKYADAFVHLLLFERESLRRPWYCGGSLGVGAWCIWKEEKLASEYKAENENGKRILEFCHQEGSLGALFDSGIRSTVLFSHCADSVCDFGKFLNISVPRFSSWEWQFCPSGGWTSVAVVFEKKFTCCSSFTSTWIQFLCLILSFCFQSSCHCQLRPRLFLGIHGPCLGMFWGQHAELEECRDLTLGQLMAIT